MDIKSIEQLEQELYKLSQIDLKKISKEWAENKHIVDRLKRGEDCLRGRLAIKISAENPKLSQNMLNLLIYADNTYADYLLKLSDMEKIYYQSQAERDTIETQINALVTLISVEKEIIKLR